MTEKVPKKPTLRRLPRQGRRAVSVSDTELVRKEPLTDGRTLPLTIQPAVHGVDLTVWAKAHREELERDLQTHGGLLFRGFDLATAADFEGFNHAASDQLVEYRERSSPRSQVSGKTYTSTDYPPAYPIFLHNENSYQSTWPLRIFFFCETPPEGGGETPIADCRKVFEDIDPRLRQRFLDRGWTYVRNFGDGLGLSWQTVFQTEDKQAVEQHCRANGITWEWRPDNRLRTRAVRPAARRHPRTGEWSWFNHATFFHISTLVPEVRQGLLEEFGEDELPTNTFYGDGSPIAAEDLDHLREVYGRHTVSFPWQRGDVLLLDNMLVAHGREAFEGQRRILVGMAEPTSDPAA